MGGRCGVAHISARNALCVLLYTVTLIFFASLEVNIDGSNSEFARWFFIERLLVTNLFPAVARET